MYDAWSICADCGEEILGFQSMGDIIQLFAIASEENTARPGPIPNSDDIALDVFRAIIGSSEWLIVPPLTGRKVSNGAFMQS